MELTDKDKENIVYALNLAINRVKGNIMRARHDNKPTGTYEYVLNKLRQTMGKFV